MNTEFENILKRISADAFASMAFMTPSDSTEGDTNDLESLSSACIDFYGPLKGKLILSISPRMLPSLACNIVGTDDIASITPEERMDALTEMLNVLCGNILPSITSPQEVFHLHQPRPIAWQEVASFWSEGEVEAKVDMYFEEGLAELSLVLERSSTSP